MSQIVHHSASKGSLREFLLKDIIRPFLPKRYGLCNGECFDAHGKVSKQLDIIVYDDLFSYAVPMGDYFMMPFESAYGEIEVKSMLNKETFLESIGNIASFKSLQKEMPDDCQVLPNLSIRIKGVTWIKCGFKKPFGVVFAYDSADPKTVLRYFQEVQPFDPSLMPDMIVLLKKKTIIFRIVYEGEQFYVTMNNTYQGYITLPCEDDTLPIFLSYGSKQTGLKLDEDGNPKKYKYIELKAVTDERICDGYYYASAFKMMKKIFENPLVLENPPEKVIDDID